jgi:flagellar biosynthetic protein FliR
LVTLPLDGATVLGVFLAFIRASAWLVVTPPFSSRVIPAPAKVAVAGGLALAVVGRIPPGSVPSDTAGLVGAALTQALTGLALGFIINVLVSAAQSAGEMIGLFGGFSLPAALDPLNEQQSNVMGQFYGLVAITALFALNAHLILVRGFLASFGAVGLSLTSRGAIAATLVHDLSSFFVSALEIAAPLIGVLFLAQIVLGLLAKAAPQLNVLVLGLPFQILLTLGLAGLAIRVLPDFIGRLVGQAVTDAHQLVAG